ncbi:MAG: hypothetical protein COB15_08585 [Flavobacteriales bacterium]|nr:MAG: hypothetical protein COB15_08585 [Flavobacteriales bacterium]
MIRLGVLMIIVCCSFLQSFAQTNDSNLEFWGRVVLVEEITEEGDTIFESDLNKKIKVITIRYFKNDKSRKINNSFSQKDLIYHYFEYDTEHVIYFACKGYNTKGFNVNTNNIPKVSDGYKGGYECPYKITLFKKSDLNKSKKKIVADVYYNEAKDFFDLK